MVALSQKMVDNMKETGEQAGKGLLQNLGASLVGGGADAGQMILAVLGQLAAQEADALFAMGALNLAIPGMQWLGAAQMAGAVGLEVLSGTLGALSSGKGGVSSGGSTSSSPSSSTGWNGAGGSQGGFGGGTNGLSLVGTLNGRNTQIMLGRNNYITGRVK
jgi:hypothetical protein